MVSYDVTIPANQPALRLLDKLDGALSPASLGLFLKGPILDHLKDAAAERFVMQGDKAAGKWQPLKESTKRIRVSKGFPPGPINVRTGRLREFVFTNNGQVMYDGLGTNLAWPDGPHDNGELAHSYRTAQAGSTRWGTPARPVVDMGFEDFVIMNALLGGWLKVTT